MEHCNLMDDKPEIKRHILSKIEDSIQKAVNKIIDSDEVRQSGAVVPMLPIIIEATLGMLNPERFERNVSSLIAEANSQLQSIEESKLDKEYPNSPDFRNLILRILVELARTERQERIKLYARILTQSMILDNVKYRSNAEDFLILCSDLTSADLALARALYERQKHIPLDFGGTAENEYSYVLNSRYAELTRTTGLEGAALQLSLTKLIRAGLIQPTIPREEHPSLVRITISLRFLIEFLGKLE